MSIKSASVHPICVMLRDLRHAAGLSLKQVEDMFEVPAVVLGSYERGDREPPLSKLDAILSIYGYRLYASADEPTDLRADRIRTVESMADDLRSIADQIQYQELPRDVSGVSQAAA